MLISQDDYTPSAKSELKCTDTFDWEEKPEDKEKVLANNIWDKMQQVGEPVPIDALDYDLFEGQGESVPTRLVLRAPIFIFEKNAVKLVPALVREVIREPEIVAHPRPKLLEDPEEYIKAATFFYDNIVGGSPTPLPAQNYVHRIQPKLDNEPIIYDNNNIDPFTLQDIEKEDAASCR